MERRPLRRLYLTAILLLLLVPLPATGLAADPSPPRATAPEPQTQLVPIAPATAPSWTPTVYRVSYGRYPRSCSPPTWAPAPATCSPAPLPPEPARVDVDRLKRDLYEQLSREITVPVLDVDKLKAELLTVLAKEIKAANDRRETQLVMQFRGELKAALERPFYVRHLDEVSGLETIRPVRLGERFSIMHHRPEPLARSDPTHD